MKKLIFLLGLVALPSAALAEDAVLVTYDDNAVVIVDLESIRKTGTSKIWQIVRFVTSPYKIKGEEVFTTKTQFAVDCARDELRRIYIAVQDRDGRYIDSGPKSEAYEPVIPGSHLEDVFRIACKGASADDIRVTNIDEAFDILLSVLAMKNK